MKKTIIGSAIVLAALVASAFTINEQQEKIYQYKATLNTWGKTFGTIDSATKYIGVKSIGYEDAMLLKQDLQAVKQDIYNQLKPQIDADSNYYKQQAQQQQQAPVATPNKK
jgi:hypothetical protein